MVGNVLYGKDWMEGTIPGGTFSYVKIFDILIANAVGLALLLNAEAMALVASFAVLIGK